MDYQKIKKLAESAADRGDYKGALKYEKLAAKIARNYGRTI